MQAAQEGGFREESLRDRKKRETREAIQVAAQELFRKEGYEGTTIRSVAHRAGVGVGTVHLHFRDKESLLLACLTRDIVENDRRSWASRPRGAPVREQLLHLAREGYRGWMRQPSLSRAVLRQMFFSRRPELDRLKELDAEVMKRTTELLLEARGKGEIREGVDPELATKAIFSFYLITSLGWLGDSSPGRGETRNGARESISEEELETMVAETEGFLALFFQGIGPLGGKTP